MIHLIKLEFKKGGLNGYLWGSLLAYAGIAGLTMMIYFTSHNLSEDGFQNYEDALNVINTFVLATFIIYASVLLSKLIINEFRDKTITLLFAYPINRKKLIFAKLSIVFCWTFVNVVLANLLVDALFIVMNHNIGFVSGTLTTTLLVHQAIYVLLQAFGAAGMSLLALVLGLRKKSAAATVASSIFIVIIMCSNTGSFNLSSIIAVPLSLAALGILITYLSFRNLDRVDVS
ncbi:ABC transporter permease subunit [Virgibacillus dakarensis]|uniref:Bacitracin ABC transporter permease n=1 Tax=Lentibacillus populi TaxID=1827502 RepID=A0A9W5X6T0_9BACI|nr:MULTISPECIES: ABC transporter permease [Bacillaceae]MTW86856.1 ABC transporter permease subunit [Virgibacillus dakarensis]GGB54436.1 bacitracin ABC transporter permease [Lentibacillus populi]